MIAVEPADSGDARRCLESYYGELARRFEAGFDPSAVSNFNPADMTPPKGWFVVARLDGLAVGCGALKALGEGVGEVKRVWIDPECRGQGVARVVMDAIEDLAARHGFAALRLDTNRALPEARNLYLRRGYREIARYNDNPYADHWFEKRL